MCYLVDRNRQTISATSKTGINTSTKSSLSFLAVAAPSVSDIERHDDSITLLQKCHSITKFLDDAQVLVACSSAKPGLQLATYQT